MQEAARVVDVLYPLHVRRSVYLSYSTFISLVCLHMSIVAQLAEIYGKQVIRTCFATSFAKVETFLRMLPATSLRLTFVHISCIQWSPIAKFKSTRAQSFSPGICFFGEEQTSVAEDLHPLRRFRQSYYKRSLATFGPILAG